MAAVTAAFRPQSPDLMKRDGITTCGYFNGNQNQPFVCPDSYSCTLVPFGAWWGCVNAVHPGLADTCFDADEAQPDREDALNCSPSAPYCNVLYLESGVVTMSTWTCGATGGTSYLLHSFTGADTVSTTESSAASSAAQTTSSTATTTSSGVGPAPSTTHSSTNSTGGSTHKSFSTAGIVGIVVGIVVLGVIVVVVFSCLRHRARGRRANNISLWIRGIMENAPAPNSVQTSNADVPMPTLSRPFHQR